MSIETILERQATALESIAKSLAKVESCFSVDGLTAILQTAEAAVTKATHVRVGGASETTAEAKKDEVTAKDQAKKDEAKAEVKKDEVVHPTEDDVKKALQAYVARAKELGLDEAAAKDQAKAFVKDVGKADGVSKLPAANRAVVIDHAKAKAAELKAPEEKKAEEVKHPTEEAVRDALRELGKAVGRDEAKRLAREHGDAEAVVDIPPEKRQAVIDAAAARMKAAAEEDF